MLPELFSFIEALFLTIFFLSSEKVVVALWGLVSCLLLLEVMLEDSYGFAFKFSAYSKYG